MLYKVRLTSIEPLGGSRIIEVEANSKLEVQEVIEMFDDEFISGIEEK